VGNRYQELLFLGQSYSLFALGKWEEVLDWAAELPEDWRSTRQVYSTVCSICVSVLVHQGNLEEAERVVTLLSEFATSADAQERAGHACGHARLLLARGDASEALRVAQIALDMSGEMGLAQEYVKEAVVTALEAALELGDATRAQQLLALIDELPAGNLPQYFRAQALRFRARLAGLAADPDAERLLKGAAGLFRELTMPFYLAVTQLEYAEWLAAENRADDAEQLLTEARATFEQLGAAPWLERADRVGAGIPATA
jgi:hypothetical protein